jgi:hypothetical protein
MLFRSHNGSMVIINKYDYKNDDLYYKKIMNVKFSNNDDTLNTQTALNYSNLLIDHLLERTSNDVDNQE